MSLRLSRAAALVTLAACSALLAGCGSGGGMPPAGTVRGTVTYQGKPVTGGTVVFHSVKNPERDGAAGIKPDGTYLVYDAPPGDTKVTVVVAARGATGMSYPGQNSIPKAAGVKEAPAELKAGNAPPAPKPVSLPAKYAKVESTTLNYTVREGRTETFDIELTD